VTIKQLRFVQIPHANNRYNQANWEWQFYHGKFYPYGKPQVPTGWELLKVNTQGNIKDVRDTFTPFQTEAIRVQKVHPGTQVTAGWFRVTEIDARGTDGQQIVPVSARTDNYHGSWRKSAWAPELYDDSTRWGDGTSVHFQNHATLNFGEVVTIQQLRFVQIPNNNNQYNQIQWMWLKKELQPIQCEFHYDWTTCTNACGTGTRTSTRVIDVEGMYGGECSAEESTTQDCNTEECEGEFTLDLTFDDFSASDEAALKETLAETFQVNVADITFDAESVQWLMGGPSRPAVSCDAACSNAGKVCDQASLDGLTDLSSMKAAYAAAGKTCTSWPDHCSSGNNCVNWGAPYVHNNHFHQGICWVGFSPSAAPCAQVPVDHNHRRLCPCMGSRRLIAAAARTIKVVIKAATVTELATFKAVESNAETFAQTIVTKMAAKGQTIAAPVVSNVVAAVDPAVVPNATPFPTNQPTKYPTKSPTPQPTYQPTNQPTNQPTESPTEQPSAAPTPAPTPHPCDDGSHGCDKGTGGICYKAADGSNGWTCDCAQTHWCSGGCSAPHTNHECTEVTATPTTYPTPSPTTYPTPVPTTYPTPVPTAYPTSEPTTYPTPQPTTYPTPVPTTYPTPVPTAYPTPEPTSYPTPAPTELIAPCTGLRCARVTVTMTLPEGWDNQIGGNPHHVADRTHERMQHAIARECKVNYLDVVLSEEPAPEAMNTLMTAAISTETPTAVQDFIRSASFKDNASGESGVSIRLESIFSTDICAHTSCSFDATTERMVTHHSKRETAGTKHMCGEQSWAYGNVAGESPCVCECVAAGATFVEPGSNLNTKFNAKGNHVMDVNANTATNTNTGYPTPAPTPAGEFAMTMELATTSNFEDAKEALIQSLAAIYGVDPSFITLELESSSRRRLNGADVLKIRVTINVPDVEKINEIKKATENQDTFAAEVATQLETQGVVAEVETSDEEFEVDAPGVTQFPTKQPTAFPTAHPTTYPTKNPTKNPTKSPTYGLRSSDGITSISSIRLKRYTVSCGITRQGDVETAFARKGALQTDGYQSSINMGDIGGNCFVIEATAQATVTEAGRFPFSTQSDDGSAMYVDGQIIVDNDGLHGMQTRGGNVQLNAGSHTLRFLMFEHGGGAGFRVRYGTDNIILANKGLGGLRHSSGISSIAPMTMTQWNIHSSGNIAQAWSRRRGNPTHSTVINTINEGNIRGDHFLREITAKVFVTTAGRYKFKTQSDDGSMMQKDGVNVVNNDGLHGMRWREGEVYLEQGEHNLRFLMFERGGGAGFRVTYGVENIVFKVKHNLCRADFFPTTADHRGAGSQRNENYCNHGRHGVVCRKIDGSGHWTPPTGCTKVGGAPYAQAPGGGPCRAGC